MATSLAQNAIALLIDLAERGEIDPWDVKVVEVIDRFLSKLQPGKASVVNPDGRSPYESDLSESGQAFLYASMLLLLKADSLVRQELAADEPPEDEVEFLDSDPFGTPLPPNLERRIRRRATSPPVQNRRVTLQELISQLNLMAAAIAEHTPRRVARRPRPQSRSQAIRAIAELAHQENLSEIAGILEQFLAEYWQDDPSKQDWLNFEDLLQLWATTQAQQQPKSKKATSASKSDATISNGTAPDATAPDATVHDRVGVFWALLFLSAQSKVELEQEEFYQDLKVRKLSPDITATGSDISTSDVSTSVLPD